MIIKGSWLSNLTARERTRPLTRDRAGLANQNLILVHSTGPVLLSGVDLERLRHDGGPEGSAILSNCTCPLSAEHRDCGGLAGPLVLG